MILVPLVNFQDTSVICRLRRNAEFRLSDASNRASATQRQGTTVESSIHVTSEGETDQMGISEGDMAIVGGHARTSSSYGSHSIEQLDSTSGSNQKLLGEPAQAESLINNQRVQTFFLPRHSLSFRFICSSTFNILISCLCAEFPEPFNFRIQT